MNEALTDRSFEKWEQENLSFDLEIGSYSLSGYVRLILQELMRMPHADLSCGMGEGTSTVPELSPPTTCMHSNTGTRAKRNPVGRLTYDLR